MTITFSVQISLGTSEVPVNPSEDNPPRLAILKAGFLHILTGFNFLKAKFCTHSYDNPPSKAPALSIPSKSFSLSGFTGVGRVKTYSLVIRSASSS